ncbi:hypothetical protein [Paratractidigestivibacter sp.]|uniref:hypothetical protein n=1 Tax=Paratractidigestivibacter sp. TaxID=2847316 RepID=UPI002AC93630|nr:hypothetical protein [Paratractidigestivibacter sp.]
MTLPEAIQRQADFADQYDAQMAAQAAGSEVESAGGVPAQQVTEEAGRAQTVQTQTTNPVESETDKLRARYSSLKGKYDSEVPRLNDRNKELEERVQQLLEENAQLREQSAQREADESGGLTDDDEAQFGAETVDLVRRGVAEGTAAQRVEIEKLRSELQRQKEAAQRAEQMELKRRDAEFVATMNRLVPGWLDQNEDQGFVAWLKVADPVYGFIRKDMLTKAANNFDGEAVASIFNQYRQELRQQQANSPLASQVSPTHTAGSTSPSAPVKWTSESIARFYDDARRGKYSDEEVTRIEKEIDDAVASGQVRY